MGNTFTDHDLRDEVTRSLGTDRDDFDVQGIVDEIQREHGTRSIEGLDTYWDIVERHAKSDERAPGVRSCGLEHPPTKWCA